MTDQRNIRVRKTPNARHPYTATMKGEGTYGWGHTPQEARDRLEANLAENRDGAPDERDEASR